MKKRTRHLPAKRKPRIIIIAGPNGAGKTTFATEFLPKEADCPVFLNADLIARGLSPFQPEKAALQAGKILLELIEQNVKRHKSFAFETTLSGLNYTKRIPDWRRKGYVVKLVFLSLPSTELAIARVQNRVAQGGHSIPNEVVRRRFVAGLSNFEKIYMRIVNSWAVYDNVESIPRLIASGDNP